MAKKTQKHPILVSIPHSSIFVPADLRQRMLLSDFQIRAHSDLYTDLIFDVKNAHVIKSKISRLVTDLNRAPDDIELEAKLCNDGVVVSVTENGERIYKRPPSVNSIFKRVEKYHNKYHEAIDAMATDVKFFIDGHSMSNVGPVTKNDAGKERADIVLGNRSYTTCSREMTHKIAKFFSSKGFKVKVNDPYEGKYIIGYHCSRRGLPGMQIEVNRKLFMNEKTLRLYKRKVENLNKVMHELVEMICAEICKCEF